MAVTEKGIKSRARLIRQEWALKARETGELEFEEAILLIVAPPKPVREKSEEEAKKLLTYHDNYRHRETVAPPFPDGDVCKRGHPRTPENTYYAYDKRTQKSYPGCRACQRERDTRRRELEREKRNAQGREYRARKKQNDPGYMERRRQANREWYRRKKAAEEATRAQEPTFTTQCEAA